MTMTTWLADRFELSRAGSGRNLPSMEGLRGLAVSIVFLTHYASLVVPWVEPTAPHYLGVVDAVHQMGNLGVDLFFVLSGYLIYGTLIEREQPFGRFIMRRAQRIYPAFLAVFLLYVALSFAMPAESKIPSPWPQGLLYLVQNLLLLPGMTSIEPMITVAWSLSYEAFYYLAIPFVIALLGLRRWPIARRTPLFIAAAVFWLVWCAAFGGQVRLAMFVAGMVLHGTLAHRPHGGPSSVWGVVGLVVGLAAMALPLHDDVSLSLKIAVVFICMYTLCLTCFGRPEGWLPTALSVAPLRWLGNMSYSYYLLHGLTLKAGFLVMKHVLPPASVGDGVLLFWLLMPVMFAATLLPSAVLFLTIERPFSLVAGSHAKRAPAKLRAS